MPLSETEQANKDIVKQYLDAFNRQDREELTELLADDVIEHGLSKELHGVDDIIEFLEAHFKLFPDYSGETGAIVAEDDIVVVRYTVSGTHTGTYQDIDPTGHTVEWTGMVMYRIEDDEIAEIWLEEDRLGLMEQLELLDQPGHLRI